MSAVCRARPALLLLGLLSIALGPACHEFDHLQLCLVSGSSLSLGLDSITIDRGEVLAFRAVPVDDDDKIRKDYSISLWAEDQTVLGVDRLDIVRLDCPGPEDNRWYFVIYGVERGETTLHFQVDGGVAHSTPVTVR
ncbi:MAG: hypothetical protein RBU30_03915 [Polyangia bacterium]|jgi:hypothetical protein|nr:hypothetical protein [Polyangia bacterium]